MPPRLPSDIAKRGERFTHTYAPKRGTGYVEEHSIREEAVPIRSCGLYRRENAGMSSEMEVGILQAEYLRFPE